MFQNERAECMYRWGRTSAALYIPFYHRLLLTIKITCENNVICKGPAMWLLPGLYAKDTIGCTDGKTVVETKIFNEKNWGRRITNVQKGCDLCSGNIHFRWCHCRGIYKRMRLMQSTNSKPLQFVDALLEGDAIHSNIFMLSMCKTVNLPSDCRRQFVRASKHSEAFIKMATTEIGVETNHIH